MTPADVRPGSEDRLDDSAAGDGPAQATRGDRVLLAAFWLWTVLLVLAALAQIFQWDGVLDALDVKRWFAR